MRDHEDGAGEPGEVLAEPAPAVPVEVVGRLVQQQHVRVGDQEAGQHHPRLLAPAQAAHRATAVDPVRAVDAQPGADLLHPGQAGPAAARLEVLQGRGVPGEVPGCRAVEGGLEAPYGRVGGHQGGGAGADHLLDGQGGVGGLLGLPADGQPG